MSDVYQAPSADLQEPVAPGEYGSIERAVTGQYDFQVFALLGEAWATLKGSKTPILLGGLIYFAVTIVLAMVLTWALSLLGPLGPLLSQIILTAIVLPMGLGIFMIALKHSVGAPKSPAETMNHFNKIIKLALTYLVMSLCILVGFVLLVLPGIYLTVAYMMAMPLIIEKDDIGIWEALEVSRKSITKKWFRFFGLLLMMVVLYIVGSIPLGIGLIWVIPLVTLAFAILYRNMYGVEPKTLAS